MSLLLQLIREQLFESLPIPSKDFSGQTIVVTGSNVGLGLEAARHFTRLNAEKVILGVRNLEKGEAARKSIEETTNRRNVVEVWGLDLASYESTKEFARRLDSLKRLDVLVENAGIATPTYRLFEDNESTITTNVVSTFLLALLALPKLQETATRFNNTPHLVIVSSEVHAFTSFPERKSTNIFNTLNDQKTADMGDRYNVSKLLEVLYCRELADHLKRSEKPVVVLNFLNPGLCHSELGRDAGWGLTILKFFLARTTEAGSRTLVAAAYAGTESHGQYLSSCRITPPSKFVRSDEGAQVQKKVYEELTQKLERIQPGITNNI